MQVGSAATPNDNQGCNEGAKRADAGQQGDGEEVLWSCTRWCDACNGLVFWKEGAMVGGRRAGGDEGVRRRRQVVQRGVVNPAAQAGVFFFKQKTAYEI